MRTKIVCVAAALASFAAAPAYAGSHVSIGFYSAPPVYYAPQPVAYYVPPQPVYYPQTYYYQPAPVAYYPRPYYAPSYGYRFSFGDWDHHRHGHREHHDWH